MNKILFFFISILTICATSCGSSSDEPNSQTDIKSKILGTWESGKYILSFNDDGFYSAYIADDFIDSGNYSVIDSKINCNNTYFNRETIYDIKSVSDSKLNVSIAYRDNYGNSQTQSLSFTKSELKPAIKDNPYISKSVSWLDVNFGYVTHTFNTYNILTRTAQKTSAAKYPLTLFYIIVDSKFYYQVLDVHIGQMPTIGGWPYEDWNNVIPNTIKLNYDGSIWGFEKINY